MRPITTNILLNAIYVSPREATPSQASAQSSAIAITAIAELQQVGICIRDHGPGIPDEIRAEVMNPFFTTKPEGEGTGLGLSVTRSIAESHGGRVQLSFPADGGTAVTLWLATTDRGLSEPPETSKPLPFANGH